MRFRIAHEVGHSFFYDRRTFPAQRLLDRSEGEELFCDAFARALLVPPTTAARKLPVPESVIELADQLDISVEVAGRALAESHDGSVVLGLQATNDMVRVLWSAGAVPFSAGRKLAGQWLPLVRGLPGAGLAMDLGRRWGKFNGSIAFLGAEYRVAVLRSTMRGETLCEEADACTQVAATARQPDP